LCAAFAAACAWRKEKESLDEDYVRAISYGTKK
jgi:hypothetical protein